MVTRSSETYRPDLDLGVGLSSWRMEEFDGRPTTLD